MASSSRGGSGESPVTYVQIEGLVVMKIIKHAHEESSGGSELVQGVLLGLVVDQRLEITNCFPFPRHSEEEDFDEVQYQMEMMRNLRHVNIDHLHVGWYQSAHYGAFLNRAFLDSQFNYQSSIEESIVLIYDPTKTNKGFLSLKAYRLTPSMMDLYREGDFTPDMIRQQKIDFQKMFEEIPIVIKNSHLINSMLCETDAQQSVENKFNTFDLATSGVLEKQLQLLMECVDDMSQDSNKFFNWQRQDARQKQSKASHIQRRQQENAARAARDEPPLPEEDLNKIFKPLQPPPRLDNLLLTGQIDAYARQISQYASQGLGKLFMAEALQHETS